ncbi:MAG: DoxX-like family protein [Chitinophagaceae bacterium]
MQQPLSMTDRKKHQLLNYFIATVWVINGLFCKVLNLVPRHQEIVAQILGNNYSRLLTILIGLLEIAMAIWILSRVLTRLNAITQILIIATMNTLEFILVPDLLLWGRANAIFAFLFILVIYYNEFYLNKNLALQA